MSSNIVKQVPKLFNLLKQHLPNTVSKTIYDVDEQQADSYKFSNQNLLDLQTYLQSLQSQGEMLERYQIGVQRNETRKNEKIAQLCGLKMPEIKYRATPEPIVRSYLEKQNK